jgi:hypothetical protein
MLIHVFRKEQGSEHGSRSDKSGGVLPNDGRPWPWLFEKSIVIKESDINSIGDTSKGILESLEKEGHFLWPAAEADGGWISSGLRRKLEATDQTYVDFSWTVWHEGVRIYDDGFPGSYLPIDVIRNNSIRTQADHNSAAAGRIAAASDDILLSYLPQITLEVYSTFQLAINFSWVAFHEGQIQNFRTDLAQGNFLAIRGIYNQYQNHNPNARGLLAAVSNKQISDLINSL